MAIVYLNGRYLDSRDAWISPDDRGFLFADGVYEVMRWYGKDFLAAELHSNRLKRSLGEIRLHWEEANHYADIARELIRVNQLTDKESIVYLQITRGSAPRSHAFPDQSVPVTCYGFARTIGANTKAQQTGVSVCTSEDFRWTRCHIKSIALLPNILAYQEAIEKGHFENLFTRAGFITEATHSNVFFVRNGKVFTHPESEFILSGVTRALVIKLCQQLAIPVVETKIHQSELPYVDEVFLTSTSAEVMPVISIDGIPVRDNKPGPITTTLQEEFKKIVQIIQ